MYMHNLKKKVRSSSLRFSWANPQQSNEEDGGGSKTAVASGAASGGKERLKSTEKTREGFRVADP